jgi:hypothetical protein
MSKVSDADKKKIDQIKKSMDKMSKAHKSGKWGKVFGWIGAVAGVIAGAALIATGVGAVAGGLLMASAVIGLAMQIAQSVPASAKWMAKNPAFGYAMMGIQIACAIGSMGAGWAGASEAVAAKLPQLAAFCAKGSSLALEAGSTAMTAAQAIKFVSVAFTAVGMIGKGSADIATAAYTKEASDADADSKQTAKDIAKLQAFLDDEMKRLKKLMDEAQDNVQNCMDILKSVSESKISLEQKFSRAAV